MGEMRLLIYHGGELSDGNYKVGMVLSDDNYEGKTDMVFVPYDLTYNDLMKAINHNVKVDLSKFSIELRAVLICTSGKRVTVKIENDSDVTFLIREDKLIPEVYVITEMRDEGYELQQVIVDEPIDHEVEEETRKRQLKLYRAAVKGDWEVADDIFKVHTEDTKSIITKKGDTVLHIATAASHTQFVKQLVEKYDIDLTAKNGKGNTAFCLAALTGNMDLVELMMKKQEEKENGKKISEIHGARNVLPIQMAAMFGHEKIVIHLYNDDKDGKLTDGDLIELLVTLIDNSLYDAALLLLNKHRHLETLRAKNKKTALHALAQKPLMLSYLHNPNEQGILKNFFNLFSGINMVHKKKMNPKALELVHILWKRIILLDDKTISSLIAKPSRLIFDAAEQGNDELLSKLIHEYPDLIFKTNEKGYTIFHVAVLYRHESVFNLIYQTGSIKDLIVAGDDNKDNILHLVAKLPPPNRLNIVSGAALQLQRELLWFEGLRNDVTPLYAEAKNGEGITPKALFTQQHKKLLLEGEEWMKKTAESCMIVATLIATVVFAAAFTVPGGVREDTGSPNFLKKVSFIIFSIFDPISLVCSTCSIITFLSILTARYALEDFLWLLPTKLVLGILTLFISIAAMMVVFCATFFILFNEGIQELAVLATVIASTPVILFIWQQHRLLWDVVRSTYISDSLFYHQKKESSFLRRKSNPENRSR